MTSAVEPSVEAIAALVDEFHVTDRALLRARERIRSAVDDAARNDFLRHVRRYFSALERESTAHITHIDRTLDDLYQRQYNAQAERSVAARRLERTHAVLAALAADVPKPVER